MKELILKIEETTFDDMCGFINKNVTPTSFRGGI